MAQLPDTIEAIAVRQTGDYDVLEKITFPFPEIGPGDIVVRVEYCGINFADTLRRSGAFPFSVAGFPARLGQEASGTVVALPTDPKVLDDPNFKRRGYELGGRVAVNFSGSHSPYAVVPWRNVYPVPPTVSSKVAAAALIQGLTVLTLAEEAYNIRQGDIIFIHTVAGGVGLLLTQLAKHRGATVIGATSTREKAELAKANGADHVILYRDEDTVKRVLEFTNGEGVHAIFDAVGKDTFENDFEMIRRKGSIVLFGAASGPPPAFAPIKLVEKNVKLLFPSCMNYLVTDDENHHYGTALFDLVQRGVLKINVFKEYPFTAKGVQEAQRDLGTGKTTGKLLLKIGDAHN